MSDPNVILETPIYHVNLTVLLSVITISLTALATLVAIYRKKPKPEELPGQSPLCVQKKADLDRIENIGKENSQKAEKAQEENVKKFDLLRDLINETSKEVGILKTQSENTTKNVDEMKNDIKEVASKLDDLLKQLLDWTSD